MKSSGWKRIALEVGGALIACIALGMAIGPTGELQLVPLLPLLLVVTYWAGKWRESGLSLEAFAHRPSAATRAAMEAQANVVPLSTFAKPDRWNICRPCKKNFDTQEALFEHQLDEHGDDLFKEAA